MFKKTAFTLAIATAALAASSNTFAQGTRTDPAMPWSTGFWGHIGVEGGQSKFRDTCRNTNVFDCDSTDSAWKGFVGGNFNDILGFEVGYTDFGKVRASGGDTKAWAVPITLTAGVPLGNRFSIFAKGGGLYGRTDVRPDASTLLDRGDKNGWGWTYGVGANFHVTPTVDIRVDWDRYRMDFVGGDRDIDAAMAGVQVRF
jgi:OmpA-OmpF porin, OOP family